MVVGLITAASDFQDMTDILQSAAFWQKDTHEYLGMYADIHEVLEKHMQEALEDFWNQILR